jgi:hypothetical protein
MRFLSAACLLALTGSVALAQTSPIDVETERYLSCLERVETNHEAAFEDALSWRMEGGGWPAAHCEARALIALGDPANGAAMLEQLASVESNSQNAAIRVAMRVEAGQFECAGESTPGLADGWRLRALARLESGALAAARQDMETAREIEPENIDILVLRGRIIEAQRLAARQD